MERGDGHVRPCRNFCLAVDRAAFCRGGRGRIWPGGTDNHCRSLPAAVTRAHAGLFLCRDSGRQRDWIRGGRFCRRALELANCIFCCGAAWIAAWPGMFFSARPARAISESKREAASDPERLSQTRSHTVIRFKHAGDDCTHLRNRGNVLLGPRIS